MKIKNDINLQFSYCEKDNLFSNSTFYNPQMLDDKTVFFAQHQMFCKSFAFEFNTLEVNASVAVIPSHSLLLPILERYLQQLSLDWLICGQ